MTKKEILDLIDKKVGGIEEMVKTRIDEAIELRKKQVRTQLQVWTGIVTAIFSFLLFIGFTKDDIVAKVRETILPKTHIVTNLIRDDEESKRLKQSIIGELEDPSLKEYPKVKATIETNIWETISTEDKGKINNFLKKSQIDEEIINSYYSEINSVLFNPQPCDKSKRIEEILKLGKEPVTVKIGHFENTSKAKTNCNLPFPQERKRAIIYFPPSSRLPDGSNRLPWFDCPDDYPGVIVSLKIEDITVQGVRVVGVERPTKEDNIQGIRARVSKSVADEFKQNGFPLGSDVTIGKMAITDIWEE